MPRFLTIRELLSEDKYRVPIYQRNYDWGEVEALQLLEDISDYATSSKEKNYYIGSVVVYPRRDERGEYYELIDGQQRLTTLTILVNVLRGVVNPEEQKDWVKGINLSYDHRPEADKALQLLEEGKLSEHPSASGITDIHRVFDRNWKKILADKKLDLLDFTQYLMNNVCVVRISVPESTDLNHYFEIMNSRGEQLEKHEVLKATLMSQLSEDISAQRLFNEIWEACSDMNSYAQMNMSPSLRSLIYSRTWLDYQGLAFDELLRLYKEADPKDSQEAGKPIARSLEELFKESSELATNSSESKAEDEDEKGRFASIINFPNFLLQVLKLMYKDKPNIRKKVRLDDKSLLKVFEEVLKEEDGREGAFAKEFIVTLLKIRTLFDAYVIKREQTATGAEHWSLKRLNRSGQNIYPVGTFTGEEADEAEDSNSLSKEIRMLQAMFHVSAPTQIYKNWLQATLLFLDKDGKIEAKVLRDVLRSLACAYMRDRYLAQEALDFDEIIYANEGKPTKGIEQWERDKLNQGCAVENFVFNFYDYVTWLSDQSRYSDFEFTYRTSVEHFYPQTPLNQNPVEGLDKFGNLCLISRGMNSKFSNHMPKAKLADFRNVAKHQSIKLQEMFERTEKDDWNAETIKTFTLEAQRKLELFLLKGETI